MSTSDERVRSRLPDRGFVQAFAIAGLNGDQGLGIGDQDKAPHERDSPDLPGKICPS